MEQSRYLATIEHDLNWATVADGALKRAGIDFKVSATDSYQENCPDFGDRQFDIAFIDGCVFGHPVDTRPEDVRQFYARSGACAYYKDNLQDAVLIFDDAQSFKEFRFDQVRENFPGFNYNKFVWFNPTGRIDRHQAIYFPEGKEHLREVVEGVARI